jgi:hypothetical protein
MHGRRLWQLLQPMPLDCEPLLFHPRVQYIPYAESLKPKTASSKLTGQCVTGAQVHKLKAMKSETQPG